MISIIHAYNVVNFGVYIIIVAYLILNYSKMEMECKIAQYIMILLLASTFAENAQKDMD